jgi:outer membrane protein OmpA-like peptidoglycan-associated protein
LAALKLAMLSFILLCPLSVAALNYLPRMDRAEWVAYSHLLNCSLTQEIPHLGTAVFDHTAGSELKFLLKSPDSPLEPGLATLKSRASVWNPDQIEEDMAVIKVGAAPVPVKLEKKLAADILSELFKGKSPSIKRRAWYDENQPIEVGLSSATFRAAYQRYSECRNNLLPVGFDRLERSRVKFDVDEYELTESHRQWLDVVAQYLSQASDVQQLYIDGHTDDTHTTTYNIELSRLRAEEVKNYLISRGAPSSLITFRFHGERYPIKSNRSAKGRAENRRVTLRVELIEGTQGPWLAAR